MRTFSEQTPASRGQRGRPALSALLDRAARASARRASEQDGFLLIEVIVSALLVALIVIATFNGFAAANKASSDSRERDQASLLAAQSQEQLRSESATALDALEAAPHKYSVTEGSFKYTITQEAKPLGAGGSTTGCSVTETSAQTGANFLVSSTVTWALQEREGRPGVKQSSVITPPTGSDIEVDVVNGSGGPVSGVTARATFVPVESGTSNTVEGTTSAAGCVVLTGLQSTEATVEILEKTGYVTPSGALKPEPKTLAIAPNLTTHYEVLYAEAGQVSATYTYKGETSWLGKQVKGDTFVVGNTKMEVAPKYEIGSTQFASCEGSEEQSKATTGVYGAVAETAVCSKYPHGDLFPFSTAWIAYAGDCTANKTAESEVGGVLVTSGNVTAVRLPLAFTDLILWSGTKASKGSAVTEVLGPVRITNSECASASTPDNSWGFTYVHEQATTIGTETDAGEGHLVNPFQPFGKFSLCLVDSKYTSSKGVKGKTFTVGYTNAEAAKPSAPTIYLGQKTASEQEEALEPYAAKIAKLESEQATEEAKRTTRETEESTERAKWEYEETHYPRIKNSERKSKEATQTKEREKTESTEATAKSKRESEIKSYETSEKPAKEANAKENESGVAVKSGESC